MERLREELERPRYELVPMRGVEKQLEYLPESATVTVTCSPSRGLGPTLDLAEEMAAKGYDVIPHLSARMVKDEEHLEEILARASEANIRRAFVVSGDASQTVGPYAGSLDLLRAIRERDGEIELGVTGYPEGHPYIEDQKVITDLLEKQPYASYVVSQLCFDSGAVLRSIEAIREQGIELPVKVGIPGAVDKKKLLEISLKVGVGDSVRFVKKNVGTITSLLRPGGYEPTELVRELGPYLGDRYYKLSGFHIYTFNYLQRTERWRAQMLDKGELRTSQRRGSRV